MSRRLRVERDMEAFVTRLTKRDVESMRRKFTNGPVWLCCSKTFKAVDGRAAGGGHGAFVVTLDVRYDPFFMLKGRK